MDYLAGVRVGSLPSPLIRNRWQARIVTIKRVRETDDCNLTIILKRNLIEPRVGAAHLKKMGHVTPL